MYWEIILFHNNEWDKSKILISCYIQFKKIIRAFIFLYYHKFPFFTHLINISRICTSMAIAKTWLKIDVLFYLHWNLSGEIFPVSKKIIMRPIMYLNYNYVTCFCSVWSKEETRWMLKGSYFYLRWEGWRLNVFLFRLLPWEINVC